MKFFLLVLCVTLSSYTFASLQSPQPNEQTLRSFELAFGHQLDVTWSTVGEKARARFFCNGVQTRAEFNNKGKLQSVIRYYSEKLLPAMVYFKVIKKYQKQVIHGITEVSTPNSLNYIIILKDKERYYTVLVDSHYDITELSKVYRADI